MLEERINGGLYHLYVTVFLYSMGVFMVIPAITDVTISALCSIGQDKCSLAIYLSGFQQAVTGLGTLVMLPVLGNLSDTYGRVFILTLPMALNILPFAILAYDRSCVFYYAYYVFKTLTSMVCEGGVLSLAYGYAADIVPENKRSTAFGILIGVSYAAFVGGNLSARFLSTPATFQVAFFVSVLALVYMRLKLPETVVSEQSVALIDKPQQSSSLNIKLFFEGAASLKETLSLFRTCKTFSQMAIISFFNGLGDNGLNSALMYYLKAKFHFSKDQFANFLAIAGIAGTASQLILMPYLIPVVGEEKLLPLALFFDFAAMFLYSIAWASWVPYSAAMFSILIAATHPCLRSIASKQAGVNVQGKLQGYISGIYSFTNFLAPLVFSPLTALFLSDEPPFHFPGFSIICCGLVVMVALSQSLVIRKSLSEGSQIVEQEQQNCVTFDTTEA